ncbi:head completion/stabilization protein [Azonexus sp. R2A61]|uniref:head completion/stabilization protein n=1 Tax=Azonexus sp. R2A61 TaxID=2744443 RepID=UPI001F26FD51|nr:head completion/stabilization protein [Azonexus sp. R2A61]
MSLVISAPTPDTLETPIVSGPFWPNIAPVDVRAQQRIDNTITPARLRGALIESIAETNHALRIWRLAQQDLGINHLADVVSDYEPVDGESALIQKYRRACGCLAKALLLERWRDFDTTAQGDKQADTLEIQIGDHRRDWHAAIADITGRTRSTVELI